MRLGLMGLDFESNNLGCAALSYGFVEILKKISTSFDDKLSIVVFDKCDIDKVSDFIDDERIELTIGSEHSIKSFKGLREQMNDYRKCDVIFDFTAGDSFSDIYGKGRFYSRSLRKELVICSRTPLVLGSQTYGPYNDLFVKQFAKHIIKKSSKVYSRDSISSDLVRKLCCRDTIDTVDVAFELPYKPEKKQNDDSIVIGFNPSGLLWSGGYTGSNQFGLRFDYQKFCCDCIEMLLKDKDVRIKLVSHVRSKDLNSRDNDMVACHELHRRYPAVEESPFFNTPMEAKSYIAQLDVFIGSRMHATIGAYTTGVATIPIAYSRKFKGLFDGLDYPYYVDACNHDLEESLQKIKDMIDNKNKLKENIDKNSGLVDEKVRYLEKSIYDTLVEINNKEKHL